MKHRVDRVRELVKRELGDLIRRELTFDQLVTIQEVDMTPDLKQAHVYVSVLGGGETAGKSVISRLQSHRKELQSLLSKRIILKYTPHLYFKLDDAIVRGTEVISILESLNLPPMPEGGFPEETPATGTPAEASNEGGESPESLEGDEDDDDDDLEDEDDRDEEGDSSQGK